MTPAVFASRTTVPRSPFWTRSATRHPLSNCARGRDPESVRGAVVGRRDVDRDPGAGDGVEDSVVKLRGEAFEVALEVAMLAQREDGGREEGAADVGDGLDRACGADAKRDDDGVGERHG